MKRDFHEWRYLLVALTLLAPSSWGQINLNDVEYTKATKERRVATPTPTPVAKPKKSKGRFDMMDDDEIETQNEFRGQIQRSKEIQKGLESLNRKLESSNGKIDPAEMLKSLGGGKADLSALMKNNKMVKMAMQQMNQMSEKDLEKMFLDSPSPYSKAIFKQFPKLATFMAKTAKDEKALKGLMKMMGDPKKRQAYMLFAVTLVVVFFLIGLFTGKNLTIFQKLKRKFLMTLLFFIVNFTGLWWFYGKELAPTVQIAKKVFL